MTKFTTKMLNMFGMKSSGQRHYEKYGKKDYENTREVLE